MFYKGSETRVLTIELQHCLQETHTNETVSLNIKAVYLNGTGRGSINFTEHFPVKSWVIFPGFNKSYYPLTNDIAILQLDGQSSLTPVQLATKPPKNGEKLIAVGWGDDETNWISPPSLMFTNVTVNSTACPATDVPPGSLCAQATVVAPGNTSSTCKADSGGPQYIVRDNVQVQASLTSFGQQKKACGKREWLVYTDIAYYMTSFIIPNMEKLADPPLHAAAPAPLPEGSS